MKKNRQKKLALFFYLVFSVSLVAVCVFPTNKIFAAEPQLEVMYPKLSSGATVTTTSLTEYLKYVFDFGVFVGFFFALLSLIWAGVLYLLSPAIPSALSDARDRVSGAISGLLILALLYLIITTINPYLAVFKIGKLESVPLPEPNNSRPGVYFYKSKDCSGEATVFTTNIDDLGGLKNSVGSVRVVHDSDSGNYYIPIIYDINNFWGRCDQISPNNKECSPVEKFASSATIHIYDFYPSGDGVYIYRKSFSQVWGKGENERGGYLKISNSQIGRAYVGSLSQLRFTGQSTRYDNLMDCTVPEDEQDCVKYNEKGRCVQKECPKLSGENISSIWISGNYLVLLIYFKPGDNPYGPWTYCQAYASFKDVNKDGPKQIKWDAIRNRNQDPNYIFIMPVKEK